MIIDDKNVIQKVLTTFDEIFLVLNKTKSTNPNFIIENGKIYIESTNDTLPNRTTIYINEKNPVKEYFDNISYCSVSLSNFITERKNKADKVVKMEFNKDNIVLERTSGIENTIERLNMIDENYYLSLMEDNTILVNTIIDNNPEIEMELDNKELIKISDRSPSEVFKLFIKEDSISVEDAYAVRDDSVLLALKLSKNILNCLKFRKVKGESTVGETHMKIFMSPEESYSDLLIIEFLSKHVKIVVKNEFLVYNI